MAIPNDSRNYMKWIAKNTATTTDRIIEVVSTVIPKPAGKRFLCYDHHFCDIPALAFVNHIVMGVIGLLACLIGILANTILIPVFNMAGIKSSATVYMTGIAVCDTISLILVVLMIVVKNLPATFSAQLQVHQTFTGYLLGFGLPVKELVELLSLWLLVALLFDRFLYRKKMVQFNQVCKRSHYVKILLILIVLLAVYTIPKFLKYKLVETSAGNSTVHARVLLTRLAKSTTFETTMLWLNRLLEIFIPYFMMFILVGILLYSLIRKKTSFEYDCPSRMISQDKIKIREKSNTIAVICISFLIMSCRLPGILIRYISTKPSITHKTYLQLQISADFLDLASLWLKPFVYLVCCRYLRQVCLDMFCLCVRPWKTREIVLAGGLGATVTIEKKSTSQDKLVHRCPTSVTLVSLNEMKQLNENVVNKTDVQEAIARRAAQDLESAEVFGTADSSSNNITTSSGYEDGSDESEKPFFHVEGDPCHQTGSSYTS